jgi:hypothetical protein
MKKQNGEGASRIFTVSKFAAGKLSFLFAAALRAGVTAGEFLDPAGGIDKFLLTGKERMAGRADTDFQVALG